VRTLVEPAADQAHGGGVGDEVVQGLEERTMRDAVEEFFDVCVHEPVLPDAHALAHTSEHLVDVAVGSGLALDAADNVGAGGVVEGGNGAVAALDEDGAAVGVGVVAPAQRGQRQILALQLGAHLPADHGEGRRLGAVGEALLEAPQRQLGGEAVAEHGAAAGTTQRQHDGGDAGVGEGAPDGGLGQRVAVDEEQRRQEAPAADAAARRSDSGERGFSPQPKNSE